VATLLGILKWIRDSPVLFGGILSLAFFGVIVVVLTWFPWIDEAFRGHDRLTQAVILTALYFAIYIRGLRRWKRQPIFWPTISVVFLLHVLGVFFYSTRVKPILLWQWPIVGLLEFYAAAFFLAWSRQRASRKGEHESSGLGGDQNSLG
jgi:magnesium-transporting ATPase (P-type)